jgi:ribonuclease HII
MNPADLPLSKIKLMLANEADPERVREWCRRLELDPRTGARAAGAAALRRIESVAREHRRMTGLFLLRAGLFERGAKHVAGVDEVGVGPLAGPVVAAAVVLPEELDLPGLNDSKKLSPKARERLDSAIREQALGFAIGEVGPADIDRLNIFRASLEAMHRAVGKLRAQLPLDHLLVDARTIPGVDLPQTALIHGDAIDGSIAAASIVAKVYRDRAMQEFDRRYPGYGLAGHKGYGTAEHMDALVRLGPSPIHRRSFAPVAAAHRP